MPEIVDMQTGEVRDVKSSTLSVLQEAVKESSIQRVASPSDMMWGQLEEMDWRKNKPWMVAKILTESPWNYTPAMALAVTMTAMEEGANPFMSDLYVISGKIVFSVQFKLKKARTMFGDKMGVPTYSFTEREWPKGKFLFDSEADKKSNRGGRQFEKDRGCICKLTVGGEPIEQTAWLSSSYRPSQPWKDDPDHMLKVRAIDYCLRFIGVGISEPIAGEEEQSQPEKVGKIAVSK